VRCKPDVNEWRGGLAHLYPALGWSVCAPGHYGYPRAPDLIVQKALTGRYYPRNFLPICALGIGIQQARVRHQMLLIIRGQSRMCGRQVLNIWINEPALWAG